MALERLESLESSNGFQPQSNYQSLSVFAKMLLVKSPEGWERLKGFESFKGCGPLFNILYLGNLF